MEVIQEVIWIKEIIGSMGCRKSRFRVTVIGRGGDLTNFYFLKTNILSKTFTPNCGQDCRRTFAHSYS